MRCTHGHTFSRAMNQPIPRKCVLCGTPEDIDLSRVEIKIHKAWVVLDENNKAIAYLDESLGEKLEESKQYHERRNYKIVELTGEIK